MLTIVVGGQYGSEGKGKVVSLLTGLETRPVATVRTGGPNAGHTVDLDGFKHISRQLPSGWVHRKASLFIGPGGVIDEKLIIAEVEKLDKYGFNVGGRLTIDLNAAIVAAESPGAEVVLGFGDRIGSTQTGTGIASIMKMYRNPSMVKLARDSDVLWSRFKVISTQMQLHSMAVDGHIIIEGTQGFGLSLHHSGNWPYCTSRDTSAAGFLSETGLSPRAVTDIVMVVRSYPIRVGGNSGPMYEEITWDEVYADAGRPKEEWLPEMTSVTKKVRRVGLWDWDLFHSACRANGPTALALHGADYINWADRGKTSYESLSQKTIDFICDMEDESGVPVRYIYTGPRNEDIIVR